MTECKIENEIKILIRGGRIMRIPFIVETIIPRVSVKEAAFDFGKITALGNSSDLEMSLINESAIEAYLVLDLRSEEDNSEAPDGIDCLSVYPADK